MLNFREINFDLFFFTKKIKVTDVPAEDEMHAEKDILRRLKAGEQAAFKHIFDEHYPMLCKVAYGILLDKAGSEDVVQELFIKLW